MVISSPRGIDFQALYKIIIKYSTDQKEAIIWAILLRLEMVVPLQPYQPLPGILDFQKSRCEFFFITISLISEERFVRYPSFFGLSAAPWHLSSGSTSI
jgi:hypothetical protein